MSPKRQPLSQNAQSQQHSQLLQLPLEHKPPISRRDSGAYSGSEDELRSDTSSSRGHPHQSLGLGLPNQKKLQPQPQSSILNHGSRESFHSDNSRQASSPVSLG